MKSERVIKGKLMNESKVPEGLALPSARKERKVFPLPPPPSTERRFLNIRREGFGSI